MERGAGRNEGCDGVVWVVNTEAVRWYLRKREERLYRRGRAGSEVLYFPELDHATVFHTLQRWKRLHVLDSFVRVLD